MKTEPYAIYEVKCPNSLGFTEMVFCHGKTHHYKVNQGILEIYNDDKLVAVFNKWDKVEVRHEIMEYPETLEEKIQDHINCCRRAGDMKSVEEWTGELNKRLSKSPTN